MKADPARIFAGGIVGKDGFKAFRRRPCFGKEFGPQGAIGAEDALLRSQGAHLLEDVCRRDFVGPEHDCVCARALNDLEFAGEVSVAGQELLLITGGCPRRRDASRNLMTPNRP